MFRSKLIAAAMGAMLATAAVPAVAQTSPTNVGVWWSQMQPGSAFVFFNPLTTMYGRVGVLFAFNERIGAEGVPIASYSVNDGAGAVLAVGFRVMPVLRLELMGSGLFNTGLNGFILGFPIGRIATVSTMQLMAAAYFDVAPLFAGGLFGFNPYVMAAIGASRNATAFGSAQAASDLDRAVWAMAYAFGMGIQYQVMNNLILDLGYRYLNSGRFEDASGDRSRRLGAHQILFTFVIPFDGLARGFGN